MNSDKPASFLENDEKNCCVVVTCDDGSKVRIHCRSADADKHCYGCESTDKPLKMCKGCMMVSYCSTGCQREHWKEHKSKCKRLDKYGVREVVKE